MPPSSSFPTILQRGASVVGATAAIGLANATGAQARTIGDSVDTISESLVDLLEAAVGFATLALVAGCALYCCCRSNRSGCGGHSGVTQLTHVGRHRDGSSRSSSHNDIQSYGSAGS